MEERRRAIVELVNKMGSVSIAQLKEAFPEVSEMTIRNDIKALDREHKLVRVYGGVRSLEFAVGADGLFDVRRNQNVDAKAAIAAKAAKLVRPNTTIYLDSGSTLAKFAAALPDEHLMVFTCGIYNVMELGHFDTVDVIVPGGTLNRYNMCLHGSRAIREIRKLRFDQVFIGAASYSKTAGLSCGSDEEAELKRACLEQAEQKVLLLDSTKLGKISTFAIWDIDQFDVIVTDGNMPADFLERCTAAGVDVL